MHAEIIAEDKGLRQLSKTACDFVPRGLSLRVSRRETGGISNVHPCYYWLSLSAYAASKPILSPNDQVQLVCEEVTQRDVGECREMAKNAGPMPNQGKSGQVAAPATGGLRSDLQLGQ